MEPEYVQTHCFIADGADRYGVSALAFDQHEELLWMGNMGGHVTSYYGSALEKYTSFQVHASQDVRQICTIDEGVLALTATSLRCQLRRGIPIFTHNSQSMVDMQCMLQVSPTRLLMSGHQENLIDFDLSLGKETNLVEIGDNGCVMLRAHSRLVCAGDPFGRITLRDPNQVQQVQHALDTHSGSLSDFDVQGNLLVTCGFSSRQGLLTCDRFLMVYDLRMMRAVSPIQAVVDPLYLRFVPSISARLGVVSGLGQWQLVDTVALSEPRLCLHQVELGGAADVLCLAFDLAASSQAAAFGDSSGSISMFATNEEMVMFNSYPRMTEHADSGVVVVSGGEGVLGFEKGGETPLAAVPLPLVQEKQHLASDWPERFMRKVYRKTPEIDPEIIKTMKMQGPIGYAPNPKTTRRNQVLYALEKSGSRVCQKLFPGENRNSKMASDDPNVPAIPKKYRRIDVKFSKMMGNEEGAFYELYNKTGYPGLEATLPNSYCNAMLQVLYYCEPLKNILLAHLCSKEFCLSCELGFLCHMLTISRGQPCLPANFLRAFRTVPEASALGLILSDLHPEAKQKTDLGALIQSWNRFILHQMHFEIYEENKRKTEEKMRQKQNKPFVYKETDFPAIVASGDSTAVGGDKNSGSGGGGGRAKRQHAAVVSQEKEGEVEQTVECEKHNEVSEISQLFGMSQLQTNYCLKCGFEVCKESILLACNLVYPNSPLDEISPSTTTTTTNTSSDWSFCALLRRSLCPTQTTPAWCDHCDKFSATAQSRCLKSLPAMLAINTGLQNAAYRPFWSNTATKVKDNTSSVGGGLIPGSNIGGGGSRTACRYGSHCSRPGCRFRHGSSAAITTVEPTTVDDGNCQSVGWLPIVVEMRLGEADQLEVKQLDGLKEAELLGEAVGASRRTEQYILTAVVCHIVQDANTAGGNSCNDNLVALIRMRSSNRQQWCLFNDVGVSPITQTEVTTFSLKWKVPCVLYYTSAHVFHTATVQQPAVIISPITQAVFGQDKCLVRNSSANSGAFTPLNAGEMALKPGELVAMDAEFVTLNQEEAELRSDGKMSTIKPSHMSVARITCIRGQGPFEGTPFIDDYISTQEQVVDYLTKFSGIKPGDLDANFSSKHLTTLKSTYQKLRFLLDNGAVFVGHGLRNDFRVINLVVPAEQVVDTVLLFHLPHHRMVSLKFLAWHFLGIKIQSETHDSAEDARAALQLYRCYRKLEAAGEVQSALTELYDAGKMLNWKVPED